MTGFDNQRLRFLFGATMVAGLAQLTVLGSNSGAVCVGDCDGDGTVIIAEVQQCVNEGSDIPGVPCPNADQNDDGVDELDVDLCIQSFLDPDNCPMIFTPVPTATDPPEATNTPSPTDAPVPTNTPSPTDTAVPNTPTPTDTAVPTPTNTLLPTPTNTPLPPTETPAAGIDLVCELDTAGVCAGSGANDGQPCTHETMAAVCGSGLMVQCLATKSRLELNFGLSDRALVLGTEGAIDVHCDAEGENGKAPCTCEVQVFAPINISAIGWVCVGPSEGCPAGEIDCDGGNELSIVLASDGDIGACTSNDVCETACEAHCAADAKDVMTSSCTAYCSDGDQVRCATDDDCLPGGASCAEPPNLPDVGCGSCNGKDNLSAANQDICQCQCLDSATGSPSLPGTINCRLGAVLNIEDNPPCGDGDVKIAVGQSCIPMTNATVESSIVNGNYSGVELPLAGPVSSTGVPLECATLQGGDATGLEFNGSVNFFGSTLGDIVVELVSICK